MHDWIQQQKKELPWDPKFHEPSLTAYIIVTFQLPWLPVEKAWSKVPQTVPLIDCYPSSFPFTFDLTG